MRQRHSIDKIVSQKQEEAAHGAVGTDSYITLHTFVEAYTELRRVAPKGDLHIHLSIEETDEPAADKRVFRTGNETRR